MRADAEVVVVGAGIMGLATAHELVRQGRDVVVLEQFHLGHARGSSHGATRIFRLAYPERAHAAFGAGLTVREDARVLRLEPQADAVQLETTVGPIAAAAVVVTAGAWARPLLAASGIDLAVAPTRETVAYFAPPAAHLPAVAEFAPGERRHAFYALFDPKHGLKAGLNGSGGRADPDVEEEPDPEVVQRVADWVAQRFRRTEPSPVHAETCLYTNTSDERFVLERHGSIVVGSACSGHGFKFAPVVGRRLAALA